MNAGALDLVTKDRVAETSFLAEGDNFDTQRYLAQAAPQLGNATLYLAAQARYTNGPFENPQNLAGYNWFGKLTVDPTPDSTLRVSTFLYDADWREAQFADDTCLANELGTQPGCLTKPRKKPGDGVHDIHFTPGIPISVLAGVQVYF